MLNNRRLCDKHTIHHRLRLLDVDDKYSLSMQLPNAEGPCCWQVECNHHDRFTRRSASVALHEISSFVEVFQKTNNRARKPSSHGWSRLIHSRCHFRTHASDQPQLFLHSDDRAQIACG